MAKIGIHIRLSKTICDVASYAASLEIPLFQCFLIQQETNQFIQPSQEEIATFVREWRPKFDQLYVHGSYWINLAAPQSNNRILLREMELAKKLEFTHIILHCGSAKRSRNKKKGIETVARNLNNALKKEIDVKIVLENTAHGGMTIGGDLEDFFLLRQHLDHPEKILFCLDTAHAYSYHYDIATPAGRADFLALVEKYLGFANVAVIHLNDTKQQRGSQLDRHEDIGSGFLGDALKPLILDSALNEIPIIMELPIMTQEREKKTIEMVRAWTSGTK